MDLHTTGYRGWSYFIDYDIPICRYLKFFFGDGVYSEGSSTGGDGVDFSMKLVYTEVFSDTGKLLYSFTDLFTSI